MQCYHKIFKIDYYQETEKFRTSEADKKNSLRKKKFWNPKKKSGDFCVILYFPKQYTDKFFKNQWFFSQVVQG